MLSGPAILRISVLLIIAGALAAVVQFLLPAAPPVALVASPARPAEPAPPAAAPAPQVEARAPPEPAPERRTEPPPPARMPADALAFPADPPPPAPAQRGEAEIARAEDTAGPRAVALVDLNTAAVADLNRLQGGGSIGRAIVAKRPYASVDQLLSKRVLSRAVYDRVKEQVTVR